MIAARRLAAILAVDVVGKGRFRTFIRPEPSRPVTLSHGSRASAAAPAS